jgi:hypothetical protein
MMALELIPMWFERSRKKKFIHIHEKAQRKTCLGDRECMRHFSKLSKILQTPCALHVSTIEIIAYSCTTGLLNGHPEKSRNFHALDINIISPAQSLGSMIS